MCSGTGRGAQRRGSTNDRDQESSSVLLIGCEPVLDEKEARRVSEGGADPSLTRRASISLRGGPVACIITPRRCPMANDTPIAFLFTWTTYGTWLPGDARGWVEYQQGFQLPDPILELECAA